MNRFVPIAILICLSNVSMTETAYADQSAGLPSLGGGDRHYESALSAEDVAIEGLLNTAPSNVEATPNRKMASTDRKAALTGRANIYGTVRSNAGASLCAMVLANGQYMFSCSPVGTYSLDVPLDDYGQVTLFGFADGHFPFKVVLPGSVARYDMTINYASSSPNPTPNPTPNPIPDPIPDPTPPTSTVTFTITDGCNDGYRINYKFFDETNNLVWPSASSYYYTEYYNTAYTSNLSCRTGANICYGGETGSYYWGVGLDDSKYCSDCCITCANGNSLSRRLTCN